MIKIALIGRMRSGKDTVADLIDAHLEMCYPEYTDVKRLAFGDKMKQLFSIAVGRPFDKKIDRRAIQEFGQSARQMLNEDVWVEPVFYELQRRSGNHQVSIVTDVRQMNEVEAMGWADCIIIYIKTDTLAQVERISEKGEEASPLELGHSTEDVEKFIPFADYIIDNGSETSLADLLTQVEDIISDIHDRGEEDED